MLEARLLECVRGGRRLFGGLSFMARPGDRIELRGPNGSGKTSLLRTLAGLLPPTSGTVLWDGEPIGANRESYVASMTYVGHRSAVKGELTSLENLRVAAALGRCDLGRDRALEVLERMQMRSQAHVQGRYLSEGQRRKLAVARLVACGRRLWLLDEILTSLDVEAASIVRALLREHCASGGMVIAATHHDRSMDAPVTRCIELAA